MPRALSAGQSSELYIYDLRTDQVRLRYRSDEVLFEAPNWTPDGRNLVVNADGRLWRLGVDDGELVAILDKAEKDGVPREKCQISRFKGLGEMNAEQLWETTLNPDTRRLLPVQLGSLDFAATEGLITKLMGKGEAAARRELMELHGDAVEVDI